MGNSSYGEDLRQMRHFKMRQQGIYIIKNCINSKVYVGSSININSRLREQKEWDI